MSKQQISQSIKIETPGILTFTRKLGDRHSKLLSLKKNSQRVFITVAFIGLIGFFSWASVTKLDRVTRTQGEVIPSLSNQMIQHLEGGIIGEILVKEGARVIKDQPLVRIEDTQSRSKLHQAEIELKSFEIKNLRLNAEMEGVGELKLPPELVDESAAIAELSLFLERKRNLDGNTLILDEQILALELEIDGLKSRLVNTGQELKLSQERTDSFTSLHKKGAVSRNEQLNALVELQKIRTRLSDIKFEIPTKEAELNEVRRRRAEIISKFKTEAAEERAEVRLEINKLQESIIAMHDREIRTYVRSPISGSVNKLFATTIGGVISPGAPIAEVVPLDNNITIESKLRPSDRARVWPGQPAVIKLTAYDYSVHGGLKGTIETISADTIKDEDGEAYFRVNLSADISAFGEERPVVPGMTAQVDMISAPRTVLRYLLTPLTKMRENAFRE